MWKAVAKGFVRHEDACFVADGLRYGFTAGVDITKMPGHRWFKNYESSLSAREPVTRAIMKRVQAQKTLDLGVWSSRLGDLVRASFAATAIFPMGAVAKPLEPTELRPTDDHSRTGLNAATSLDFLRHSLTAYEDIAWFLAQDYFMRVSDVEAAFPLLPLHPDVWPFFLFRFFADASNNMHLFVHVTGDFGAAGMPGVFKKFFSDVVVGMARSVQVLTLPMVIYVDDCGLIGGCRDAVDAEMVRFHTWAWVVCGIVFKAIKDRVAAQNQLMLGFWWDSRTFTRTLEERKLLQYVDLLANFASRTTLTLRELQSVAGRMQRCIMTFPPGAACLLVSVFTLMVGLRLPWHARRTTRATRKDFSLVHQLLTMNLGRGYFSYSNFTEAPEVNTDASKSSRYTGGGYVSRCGMYNWWKYGSRAARRPIDFLEGDTVVVCAQEMGPSWFHKMVPIGIDNMAFEKSAEKGRSRVERLNSLVRELFMLQVKYHFIFWYYWLPSKANFLADALSRQDGIPQFMVDVYSSGFWGPGTVPIPHGTAGHTRQLPEVRGEVPIPKPGVLPSGDAPRRPAAEFVAAMDSLGLRKAEATTPGDEGATYAARAMAAPARRSSVAGSRKPWLRGALAVLCFTCCLQPVAPAPVSKFSSSVSNVRSSIFNGLPADLTETVETLLDNRLSSSSWRTVKSGMRIWKAVAVERDWPHIIVTDDPERGGKLTALVCSMLTDTDLVWGSIEAYTWGVRQYMIVQHQADPALGVMSWDTFMASVKVVAWVPGEPRKMVPISVISSILDDVDLEDFMDVQMAFMILLCLYTYSRSESPCPKSYTGRESYYD